MAGNLKDYATGIVVTAPSPATSGTSLTLQTGEGARMPAVPFAATAHPTTEMPTLDNAEKILVTDVTGDVLTITRAQGETTAKSIVAGWRVSNALFADDIPKALADLTDDATHRLVTDAEKTVISNTSGTNTGDNAANTSIAATKLDDFTAPDDNTDLNATTSAHGLLLKATAPAAGLINVVGIANGETSYANKALFDATNPTNCILGNSAAVGTAAVAARRDHQHAMPTLTTMYNLFYPVGCIYTTTVSTNPGTLFGIGTWEAFGEGKVLVGKAAAGTFNTAGATGGAETVTLTSAQSGLPAHSHTISGFGTTYNINSGVSATTAVYSGSLATGNNTAANAAESHTNLQPYIVVYFWKRTA